MRRIPLAALLLAGCSPARPADVVRLEPRVAPAKPTAKAAPRWVAQRGLVQRRVRLGAESVLLGIAGERWLLGADGKVARMAEEIAPERLVGGQRVDARVRYVGVSGTTYVADGAMGSLRPGPRPAERLLQPTAGARSIVAIRGDDLLRTTDGGASWSKIALPVLDARPLRLAMAGERGLALFGPERLLATSDDGATWTPIEWPTHGLEEVSADNGDDVFVKGGVTAAKLAGTPPKLVLVEWPPNDLAPFGPLDPFGGSTTLWHASRSLGEDGTFVGRRWFELTRDDQGPRIATELLGDIGKHELRASLAGCSDPVMDATPSGLVVACVREGDDATKTLRLYDSADEGKTIVEASPIGAGPARRRGIFRANDGRVLVRGACASPGAACKGGVVLRTTDGVTHDVVTEGDEVDLQAIAFGAGTSVWGAGFAGKGKARAPTVFRSRDGGLSFARVALPVPTASRALGTRSDVARVGVDAAGEPRAVAFSLGDRWALYASTDGGVTFEERALPKEIDALDVVGPRVIARAFRGEMHESADAGARWVRIPAPYDSGALRCGDDGCWLGTAMARIGWTLETPGGGEPAPKPTIDLGTATPLRCHAAPWQAGPRLLEVPSFGEPSPDGVAWVAASGAPGPAEPKAVVARRDANGELVLESTPLFGPKDGGTRTLVYGGVVFAMQTLDPWAPKPPPAWRPQIAIYDVATRKVVRMTLREAPLEVPIALLAREGNATTFHVGSELWLVSDAGAVLDRRAFPDPGQALGSLRLARKGDAWLAWGGGQMNGAAFVATSPKKGAPWALRPLALWPGADRDDLGFVFPLEHDGAARFAVFHGPMFEYEGAFLASAPRDAAAPKSERPIPTLRALGNAPAACPTEAARWPSVELEGRTFRHAVLLDVDGQEELLRTGRTVLAVAADGRACVRGFVVRPLDFGEPRREGWVPLDDLAHATLLGATDRTRSQVTSMRCEWAPGAFTAADPRAKRYAETW
jgi:hypothetical protein